MRLFFARVCATLLMLLCCGIASAKQESELALQAEKTLTDAISNITRGNFDEALKSLEQLNEQHPTFRLGNLVYADLKTVKYQSLSNFGEGIAQSDRLALGDELLARWKHYKSPSNKTNVPESIVQLNTERERYAIVVELSKNRMYLFENHQGVPVYLNDFYVTIGKDGFDKSREGDKKTPLGAYHLETFKTSKELPSRYGFGAYPLNYPNSLDQMEKRSGSGIWLHGQEKISFSRPPLDSAGCIVINNAHLEHLKKLFDSHRNVPIVLVKEITWLTKKVWQWRRKKTYAMLAPWLDELGSNKWGVTKFYYNPEFNVLQDKQKTLFDQDPAGEKNFVLNNLTILQEMRSDKRILSVVFAPSTIFRKPNPNVAQLKKAYWEIVGNGIWKIDVKNDRTE